MASLSFCCAFRILFIILLLRSDPLFADFEGSGGGEGSGNSTTTTLSTTLSSVPPFRLLSFDLDLSSGLFTLHFSDVVASSGVDISVLVLQSAASVNSPLTDTLSLDWSMYGGNVLPTLFPSESYNLYSILPPVILNALKSKASLCRSASSCYLSFPSSFAHSFQDEVQIEAISILDALGISSYGPDIVGPYLTQFNVSSKSLLPEAGFALQVCLEFNEPILVSAASAQSFDLCSSASSASPSSCYTINQPSFIAHIHSARVLCLDVNSSVVDILRGMETPILREATTTFLRVPASFVTDVFGVPLIPMKRNFPVSFFSVDIQSPSLLTCELNLDRKILVLSMSEPFLPYSFQVNHLKLVSSDGLFDLPLDNSLQNRLVFSEARVEIFLDIATMYSLKIMGLSADSADPAQQSQFILSVASNAFLDSQGNPNFFQELLVEPIVADTRLVKITSFDFDLLDGQVQIDLDDFIDLQSLNLSQLQFTTSPLEYPAGNSYPLSSSTANFTASFSNNPLEPLRSQITITFSPVLRSYFETQTILGVSPSSTFLSLADSFVADLSGNAMVLGPPLQVRNLFSPNLAPYLLSFSLAHDVSMRSSSSLYLVFSKAVMMRSFSLSKIQIMATIPATSNASNSVALSDTDDKLFAFEQMVEAPAASTERYVLVTDTLVSSHIGISLSEGSLARLRNLPSFGFSVDTTYLSIADGACLGFNNLSNVKSEAMRAHLVADVDFAAPALISFSVNMNASTLSLSFDEKIAHLSLSGFALGTVSAMNSSDYIHLSLQSRLQVRNETEIQVSLSRTDMDSLASHSPPVCLSASNCFLFLFMGAFSDSIGNVYGQGNIQGSTSPIEVFSASEFIADSASPALLSFTFQNGILAMKFSEFIPASSVDPTKIVFLNHPGSLPASISTSPSPSLSTTAATSSPTELTTTLASSTQTTTSGSIPAKRSARENHLFFRATNESGVVAYQLTSGQVTSLPGAPLTVALSSSDIANMQTLKVGTSPSNTFLVLLPGAVVDASGNSVTPIDGENAIGATNPGSSDSSSSISLTTIIAIVVIGVVFCLALICFLVCLMRRRSRNALRRAGKNPNITVHSRIRETMEALEWDENAAVPPPGAPLPPRKASSPTPKMKSSSSLEWDDELDYASPRSLSAGKMGKVVQSFKSPKAGHLSCQKGDVVNIVGRRGDWYDVVNGDGDKGLVPMRYISANFNWSSPIPESESDEELEVLPPAKPQLPLPQDVEDDGSKTQETSFPSTGGRTSPRMVHPRVSSYNVLHAVVPLVPPELVDQLPRPVQLKKVAFPVGKPIAPFQQESSCLMCLVLGSYSGGTAKTPFSVFPGDWVSLVGPAEDPQLVIVELKNRQRGAVPLSLLAECGSLDSNNIRILCHYCAKLNNAEEINFSPSGSLVNALTPPHPKLHGLSPPQYNLLPLPRSESMSSNTSKDDYLDTSHDISDLCNQLLEENDRRFGLQGTGVKSPLAASSL